MDTEDNNKLHGLTFSSMGNLIDWYIAKAQDTMGDYPWSWWKKKKYGGTSKGRYIRNIDERGKLWWNCVDRNIVVLR